MREPFYICRVGRDLTTCEPCFSYLSKGYGWCKSLNEAKSFKSIEVARTQLNGRVGNILSESEVRASKYYLAEMKNKSPKKPLEVEVLKPVKMANNAILKTGDDAATAKQLNKLFADAQNGMRRIVALGLFAWEVKLTKLKHGQWGPWLAANCPKLATVDADGKAFASRALRGYMDLTESVLRNVGFPTIEKYLSTAAKSASDAHLKPGAFMLIADKKVPEAIKEVREKICAMVDGKTQYALFTEFKQAEDDKDGVTKKKHGRLAGSSGLTAEMREMAAQKQEEERIIKLDLEAEETAKWLLENADAKNAGCLGNKQLLKLQEAAQTMSGFIARLIEARKAQKETEGTK